jgi:hypothetical protein
MAEALKKLRSHDARHRTAVAAAACRWLPARRGHAAAACTAETRAQRSSCLHGGDTRATHPVARCVERMCAGREGAHSSDRTRGTHGAGRSGSRSPARRSCILCASCPERPLPADFQGFGFRV